MTTFFLDVIVRLFNRENADFYQMFYYGPKGLAGQSKNKGEVKISNHRKKDEGF